MKTFFEKLLKKFAHFEKNFKPINSYQMNAKWFSIAEENVI